MRNRIMYFLMCLLFSFFSVILCTCNEQKYDELFVIREKYNSSIIIGGYIDNKGTVIVKPQYLIAEKFSEGLGCVQIHKSKYGYLNTKALCT